MATIDLKLSQQYLRSPKPDLREFGAWLTLNDQAAGGSRLIASLLLELIEEGVAETELAMLAAGPVRELLMSDDGEGFNELLEASHSSSKVRRILLALRRYWERVQVVHAALRKVRGAEIQGASTSDYVLARLKSVSDDHGPELPLLPQWNRPIAQENKVVEYSDSIQSTMDLDSLISANPMHAWERLSSAIQNARDDSSLQSLAWYLGLLLDFAEDEVRPHVLERCREAPFALALESADLGSCSEGFLTAMACALAEAASGDMR